MPPRKVLTAAELQAELASDPEFQERKRKRDAELRARQEYYEESERPIVDELRRSGFNVASVWDFVNDKRPTPALAAQILLDHLPLQYPDRVKEGIGRALAVSQPHEGWKTLLRAFEQNPDQSTLGSKFALGLALAAATNRIVLDDVVRLVRDPVHGEARLPLLWALKRLGDSQGLDVLREQATDPLIGREARRVLRSKSASPTESRN